MKHGKKPTRAQRKLIGQIKVGSHNLKSDNWLVVKCTTEELHIIHRERKTSYLKKQLEMDKGSPETNFLKVKNPTKRLI